MNDLPSTDASSSPGDPGPGRRPGAVQASVNGGGNPVMVLLEARRATEDTIRAYDNKAQIAGVGLILSINAALGLRSAFVPTMMPVSAPLAILLGVAFVASIVQFAWVLWPIRVAPVAHGPLAEPTRATFFVTPQDWPDLARYVDAARRTDWPTEIAYEIMKLAVIRQSKQRRFARALVGAAALHALLLVTGIGRLLASAG